MKKERLSSRFLITTEKKMNEIGQRIVGSAYQVDGEAHLRVYLRLLPGITFFLSENWMSYPEYILFSGRAHRDSGDYRFFHRIGSGYKLAGQNVIEVHIPDLTQSYFIHLAPADFHLEENHAA